MRRTCWIWRSNVQASTPELHLRILAGLILALLLCYANALGGDFQFDDYKVIVDNPAVQSWEAWRTTDGQGALGLRPLLKLSYLLNWTSGTGVLGFHLVNVAIHLANTMLVYGLAMAWMDAQRVEARVASSTLSGWTALLFALHPIHTEAVTYVCGRSTSLMTLFYMAGLLVYVRSTIERRPQLYATVPVLFALALAVKETAVTFPLALLAWELARGTRVRTIVQRQWPAWLMLVVGASYFLLNDRYLAQMQRSVELNSLLGNLATQSLAFAYLLRQWTLPLWLNIDPDLPLLHGLTDAALFMLGLLASLLVLVGCWRNRPWVSFALLWALIHLVPLYLFLPRLDIANDRQLVLVAWPLAMALVLEAQRWLQGRLLPWVLGALALVLGGLTVLRNQDYASEIALWESTVQLSPNKARVHNNLGYAYKLAGRVGEARREYTAALRLDPGHIKARYNLQRLDQP